MKYNGEAILPIEYLDDFQIPHINGRITGKYLIEDIICGELIDIVDCSLTFEWWARVKKDTIVEIK